VRTVTGEKTIKNIEQMFAYLKSFVIINMQYSMLTNLVIKGCRKRNIIYGWSVKNAE
jgi:hypothetical protein